MSKKKAAAFAKMYLLEIEKENGSEFNKVAFNKIVDSYSLYLPIVMDAFTSLNGRFTNESEKLKTLNYFIMSSLFDDFVDHSELTENQIREFVLNDSLPDCHNFKQIVCRKSHLFLLAQVALRQEYLQTIEKVMQAQIDSKRQKDPELSLEEIETITLNKGGFSVLLCHYYLEESDESWKQIWFQLGGLIQMTNDLYDIYKDLNDHISTFSNTVNNMNKISYIYSAQFEKLFNSFEAIKSDKNNGIRFRIAMIGTYAFGLVAIENLRKLASKDGVIINLKELERHKLIIDMSKWSNIKRWLQFVHSLSIERC